MERTVITAGILVLFFVWLRTKELPIARLAGEMINSGSKKGLALLTLMGLVAALQISGVQILPIFSSGESLLTLRLFGLLLYLAGIFLSSWAKTTLGPNWDPETEDRPLVTHGPYRLLPHPIYTGGYLAAVGAQLLLGSWLFLLGLPMICVIKRVVQKEERELLEEFGDAYREYQATTVLGRLFAFRQP